MENSKLEKFDRLISDQPSGWLEKAKWRQANQEWLDKSAAIALKILRTIRSKHISQKDLANSLGVSPQYINKIVKGNENLSLETITKLEKVLGVILIEVPSYIIETEYEAEPTYSTNKVNYSRPVDQVKIKQPSENLVVWSSDPEYPKAAA